MGYNFSNLLEPRHKVFVSYYHYEDQYYKNLFEDKFRNIFINKSVMLGDIDSDNSDIYIKRIIQESYITDSSVLIVLVGPNTKNRKHVDWEISAALNKKVGGYSGLVGILLPTFPLAFNRYTSKYEYNYSDLPPRLADNVISGYADIYTWQYATECTSNIKSIVQLAFNKRVSHKEKIDNSRIQFVYNR